MIIWREMRRERERERVEKFFKLANDRVDPTLSFSYQYIARGLDSLVIIESGAYLVENVERQTWSLSLQTVLLLLDSAACLKYAWYYIFELEKFVIGYR